MSWHIEARGKKANALAHCLEQKYFRENAPAGVVAALNYLSSYFPESAVVSIVCNGHLQGEGGNIRIEIANIPAWIE